MPKRVTGRSVTSFIPSAPTIGPRRAPMVVVSRTEPSVRPGAMMLGDHSTCQASSASASGTSVW